MNDDASLPPALFPAERPADTPDNLASMPFPASPAPIGEQEIAAVARAAVEAATNGNMYGAEVARRLWCEYRRAPVTVALPALENLAGIAQAQTAIIEAAACGQLAPRDALAFSTMIEHRRRAIETLELEAELRNLNKIAAEQLKAEGGRR